MYSVEPLTSQIIQVHIFTDPTVAYRTGVTGLLTWLRHAFENEVSILLLSSYFLFLPPFPLWKGAGVASRQTAQPLSLHPSVINHGLGCLFRLQ